MKKTVGLNLLNEILEDEMKEEWEEWEEEWEKWEEWEEWEQDYKALYQQQQAETNKRKNRYKSSKATEQVSLKKEDIDKMVSDSLWAVKFYEANKVASDHKEEIETFVSKWLDREQAYKLVMADKDPTVLLDEAKRNQLAGNTWLQGVSQSSSQKTNYTDEEIMNMSSEDFDKMNTTETSKKFYAET